MALLLCAYNSISLAAKSGNEIVGFIIGRLRLERDTIIGHVITIDVSASNHSRGIGQTLLQEIEKAFKEKNAKMCQLEVREDNAHALRLYRKNGYVEIGKLKNYYGSKHGLCMMKKLA